jgi:cell division protein FtsB
MRRLNRLFLPALFLLAAYYAVFGGEYSYLELRRARAEAERQKAELADLRGQVDSLKAWADSLENDPATLERIARERFGMIRDGERLYRFVGPDPGRDSTDGGTP